MVGKKIVIVGAGKVGFAIASSLTMKGYEVIGAYSKSFESAKTLTNRFGGIAVKEPETITLQGDIVFITTPDSEIEQTAVKIANNKGFRKGQMVFHMSGALTSLVLARAAEQGANVGSIHPLQSFADKETAALNIKGSIFAIEGQENIVQRATDLVLDLEGEAFVIDREAKPLYHAAACIAANYLVVIINSSLELLKELGIPKDKGWQAISPLIKGTIKNISSLGTINALTGPIARGDDNIVKEHLATMKATRPDILETYRLLGQKTLEVALEKGSLSLDKAYEIGRILEEEVGCHKKE